MKAYLHPKPKPNHTHYYAYDVVFDGERIVTDSRDPEHDLVRALLARGIKGHVRLVGPGCSGASIHRTTVNIEKAAPWCVGSNLDHYRWKAPGHGNHSPHTGEEPLILPAMQAA